MPPLSFAKNLLRKKKMKNEVNKGKLRKKTGKKGKYQKIRENTGKKK